MQPIFSKKYRVYWSETDAAQIMHFSNFFRACERTEEDFWQSMGLKFDPSLGVIFPRAHASCDYHSPLHPGDTYRVDITRIIVGRTSITYYFQIYNEDKNKLSAECRIVAVAYSTTEKKPIPIPGQVRQLLYERGAEEKTP